MTTGKRVALVHDWLVGWGGAEQVLAEFADLYPQAPIFTAVWAPDSRVAEAFGHREIRTTALQGIPGAGRRYRSLLPLMPGAFRRLDLSEFDLVISSSHAFSKAVRVRPDAEHICYCHTPPRYLWDLYDRYSPGWRGVVRAPVAWWLREADRRAADGVTRFVANSATVAGRIRRNYGREAEVLFPPVALDRFLAARREKAADAPFLAGGRLVPYKGVEVAIRGATLAGVPLEVFGDGPDRARLEALAGPTVRFLGRVSEEALPALLARARAYLFPAEEDFGILPVEAMAAGTPVLAYGRGGGTETVGALGGGELISSLDPEEWAERLRRFGAREPVSPDGLERFSTRRFREGWRRISGGEGAGVPSSVREEVAA